MEPREKDAMAPESINCSKEREKNPLDYKFDIK
jgi:hypothetical protein